jgi:hypothetical protein
VLTTNTAAIQFYERRHFRQHAFLPYYYSIQGSPRDGYCYVLYINGGAPPWTIAYPCPNTMLVLVLLSSANHVVSGCNTLTMLLLINHAVTSSSFRNSCKVPHQQGKDLEKSCPASKYLAPKNG